MAGRKQRRKWVGKRNLELSFIDSCDESALLGLDPLLADCDKEIIYNDDQEIPPVDNK